MKNKSGFTLVELIVAFGILAVLMVVAIPNFSVWKANTQLKDAANDLYNTMQRAKMGAISKNRDWRVTFNTSGGTYSLIDSVNGTLDDADDITVETINLNTYGSGVGYGHGAASSPVGSSFGTGNVTFSGSRVTFDSRGMRSGGSLGYVYLSNNQNNSYAVGLNSNAGNVTIKKWTGSDWE